MDVNTSLADNTEQTFKLFFGMEYLDKSSMTYKFFLAYCVYIRILTLLRIRLGHYSG